MHHTQKKKFQALKAEGVAQEELKAQMLAAGIAPEEIEAFLSETGEEQPGENAPQGKHAEADKARSNAKAQQEPSTPIYEEWKMEVAYAGGQAILSKVKKIKDVKIHDDRAERLNEHAANTKIKYFPK